MAFARWRAAIILLQKAKSLLGFGFNLEAKRKRKEKKGNFFNFPNLKGIHE